jgi:hypothetical protein
MEFDGVNKLDGLNKSDALNKIQQVLVLLCGIALRSIN